MLKNPIITFQQINGTVMHIVSRCSRIQLGCNVRHAGSLVGRDLKTLKNYTADDIKSLLWTAFDLLKSRKQKQQPNTGAKITFLLDEPDIKLQLVTAQASYAIGAHLNVIIDPKWEQTPKLWTIGRLMSTNCNMLLIKGKIHSNIEQVCDGARIPVINVSSAMHCPMQVLGDLMTVQSKYAYLKGLTVAYVSPPGPLLNSYLCVLPKLGINLRFASAPNPKTPVSPTMLKQGQTFSRFYGSEIHECLTPAAALNKADVIVTTQHTNDNLYVRLNDIQTPNWVFLHSLPRGSYEVDDNVFCHNNSLVWEACFFLQAIYAAAMLRLLTPHKNKISMPDFDNITTNIQCQIQA